MTARAGQPLEHRILDVLEAAYDVTAPEDTWLDAILESALPLVDRGLGASAWFVDLRSPGVAGAMTSRGHDARRLWDACVESAGIETMRASFSLGTVANVVYGSNEEIRAAGRAAHVACGVGSFTTVCSLDAAGRALAITVPSPPGKPAFWPTGPSRDLWERLGAHLTAAARLRSRLGSRAPDEAADVVLSREGRVLDRPNDAVEARVLAQTQRSIAARAGRPRSRSASEELAGRTALESGTFSILARGRRLLAVANPSHDTARKPLSHRETQVAELAARGHSNKQIAYELGIAYGSVLVLLRRAATKLGVTSRAELVASLRRTPATGS